jgi:hypothetical protein
VVVLITLVGTGADGIPGNATSKMLSLMNAIVAAGMRR